MHSSVVCTEFHQQSFAQDVYVESVLHFSNFYFHTSEDEKMIIRNSATAWLI